MNPIITSRNCYIFQTLAEATGWGGLMPWFHYIGYFMGGAFLANALPHLMAGVAGQPLQSPFASPPFKGLSSPIVNVVWALANLAIAYLLLGHIGSFRWQSWSHFALCFAGFSAMALQCARSFARLRKQNNLQ
jgi:TM2 domain-containing membrane protein YozV